MRRPSYFVGRFYTFLYNLPGSFVKSSKRLIFDWTFFVKKIQYMYNVKCDRCGCLMRKARPQLIIVNLQVVLQEESDNQRVWECINPNCRGIVQS